MSQQATHSRQTWRVRGQLQDYLLVKRSNLTADEVSNCMPSVFIVAELDRWLSSVYARKICYELYEVVTGTALNGLLLHQRSVDREHLKRCIAEAFRNGRLAALPLGPIRSRRSGGARSDASRPPPGGSSGFSPVSKSKRIVRMYWTYGEEETPVGAQSRFYVDLNLHIETENYAPGELIDITILKEDGESISEGAKELKFTAVVGSNNEAKIKNIFGGSRIDIAVKH
ncbi:MAG: hypothetical protein ACXU86_01880 [Archangium sp.]